MQIRTPSSLLIGALMLCGLTPGWSGEPLGLDETPWAASAMPDQLDVPLLLDGPRETPDLMLNIFPAEGSSNAGHALMATPADAVLMGRAPGAVLRPAPERIGNFEAAHAADGWDASWITESGQEGAKKVPEALHKNHDDRKLEMMAGQIAEGDRKVGELESRDMLRGKAADMDLNPAVERAGKGRPAPAPATPEKIGAPGVSELYLQGHLTMKDGMGLEQAGRMEAALDKFREAQKQFDAVHQLAPNWNAEIVEYRRKKTGDEIKRLRNLVTGSGPTAGEPAPEKKSGPPSRPAARFPDAPPPGDGMPAKHDKKEKKPKPGKSPVLENPELEMLRQRLRETEQALGDARRRESGLRTVVRDLLNEMETLPSSPQAPPIRR